MSAGEQPPPRRVLTSKAFEKDVKRLGKRGKSLNKLWAVVEVLRARRPLESRHSDHALTGEWQGCRDCHIESDWVLIYELDDQAVFLARTGTHADLFE